MLNSNFCKMFKNRLKLRKVATIVACLAVTTMFASCDKTNGDDDDDGGGATAGKIDQKLVGFAWRAGLVHYGFIYLYFYPNGEFTQEVRMNSSSSGTTFIISWEEVYKGNYSADGGTLTFTFKSAEHRDAGKAWQSITPPVKRTLTYTFGESEYQGVFFDLTKGGMPPFNAPVTLLNDQKPSDTPVLTRFLEYNFDGTIFER